MITIHNLTVSQVFQAARYIPEHEDQIYDWQPERVKSLVQGLISVFFAIYEPHHGREDFQKYTQVAFGSLCLRVAGEERAFLEGHKFFITLTLLLINLHLRQTGRNDRVELDNLLSFFRKDSSRWDFNPHFKRYGDCLRDLIRGEEIKPGQVPLPVLNLVACYREISAILREEINDRAFPFFAAWLRDKVLIEVSIAEDDRGARILQSARAYQRLRAKLMRELSEEADW